jgi:hypothetical protein
MSSPTTQAAGKAAFQLKPQSWQMIRDRRIHFDSQKARSWRGPVPVASVLVARPPSSLRTGQLTIDRRLASGFGN